MLKENKTFLELFPNVKKIDLSVLERLSITFPEVHDVALEFEGDYDKFIMLLKSTSIYSEHIRFFKEELKDENQLPDWFIKKNDKDVKEVIKTFEHLSSCYKKVADITIDANKSYNKIMIGAETHRDKIRELNSDLRIYILKLRSSDLMLRDGSLFLKEVDKNEKLFLDKVKEGKDCHFETLGNQVVSFSTMTPELRISYQRTIRKNILDGYRRKYYETFISDDNEDLVNHLTRCRDLFLKSIASMKTIPNA